MKAKQVTVTVLPDGSVEIEGHGFVGPDCEKYLKVFEDALGVVKERKKKPEWNQKQVRTQGVGA